MGAPSGGREQFIPHTNEENILASQPAEDWGTLPQGVTMNPVPQVDVALTCTMSPSVVIGLMFTHDLARIRSKKP